jgi:hypothetical protein
VSPTGTDGDSAFPIVLRNAFEQRAGAGVAQRTLVEAVQQRLEVSDVGGIVR